MPSRPLLKGEEIYRRGSVDQTAGGLGDSETRKPSSPSSKVLTRIKPGEPVPARLVERVAYALSLTRFIPPTASFSNLSLWYIS